MKEKIKNFFGFLGNAWRGGWRGRAGIFLMLFALVMFGRVFLGEVNVQNFIMGIWRLDAEQQQLAAEIDRQNALRRDIDLLQGYSADYVEELGLKYLNIGDPKFKILKI